MGEKGKVGWDGRGSRKTPGRCGVGAADLSRPSACLVVLCTAVTDCPMEVSAALPSARRHLCLEGGVPVLSP